MGWGVHDYPEPPANDMGAVCPVCGSPCYTIYKNTYGEVLGCDECVDTVDAINVDECYDYPGAIRR